MKKLLLLLALFPVMLFAQSNNAMSFKIEKKANKDTAVSSNSPFEYSFSYYRNIASLLQGGKLLKSQLINTLLGFNIALPKQLTTMGKNTIFFAAVTGLYDNPTVNSRFNISAPFDFGLHLMNNQNLIGISAGPRFYFPSSDPILSNNILFEWGGGYATQRRIGRHWLSLGINYKRLANENFLELLLRYIP